MEQLIIRSRMQHFQVLTRIQHVSKRRMRAIATFAQSPSYCLVESMAQLAAMHVRHSLDFDRHAFLLKIQSCDLTLRPILNSDVDLTAERISHSSNAFAYRVSALVPDGESFGAELLIGTREYDRKFRKECLNPYYQKRFETLFNRDD